MAYAPPTPPLIPARHKGGRQDPRGGHITIHSTVGPTKPGAARVIGRYFQITPRDASAHYGVDPGEVIQYVGDHTIAYHAPPNNGSLGVELCDYPSETDLARWDDPAHRQMLARAATLVAQLCLAYDIRPYYVAAAGLRKGVSGVTTHAQVRDAFHQTTHWDPGVWPRRRFMRMVRQEVARLQNQGHDTPAPAPVALAGLKKPKKSPSAWTGFLHLTPYFKGDSLRAIREAGRRKGRARAIDLNWHLTKDGVWVNTHWDQPLLHGFHWDTHAPKAAVALGRNVHIEQLTWAQVKHLVATGGYRIGRAEHLLQVAADLGVRVEFEDKGGGGPDRYAAYRRLAAIPAVKELRRRGLIQVKTLTQIPGAAHRLKAAKAAGFTTIVSTTNAASKRVSVREFGPVADFVRGRVEWVA